MFTILIVGYTVAISQTVRISWLEYYYSMTHMYLKDFLECSQFRAYAYNLFNQCSEIMTLLSLIDQSSILV